MSMQYLFAMSSRMGAGLAAGSDKGALGAAIGILVLLMDRGL